MNEQEKFDSWAVVELFGHQQIAGRVSEASIGGAAMSIQRIPVEAFVDAGCELIRPFPIFLGIYSLSSGQPCAGCGYDHDGKCEAKRKILHAAQTKPEIQSPTETTREMAARLGVSLSEARRIRRKE